MNKTLPTRFGFLCVSVGIALLSTCSKTQENPSPAKESQEPKPENVAASAPKAPSEEEKPDDFLQPGKPVQFELDGQAQNEDSQARFRTRHSGSVYQSIRVSLKQGSATLNAEMKRQTHKYGIHNKGSRQVHARDGLFTLIDDLPQLAGEYFWTLSLNRKAPAQAVEVELIESHPFAAPDFSSDFGAILVRGIGRATVSALPDNRGWGYIRHDDFTSRDFIADKTPEGNALLWLPTGLWTLSIQPEDHVAKRAKAIYAQLIPVRANKITEVDSTLR